MASLKIDVGIWSREHDFEKAMKIQVIRQTISKPCEGWFGRDRLLRPGIPTSACSNQATQTLPLPSTFLAFQFYVQVALLTQIWSPHYITLINLIESVQRSFTKRLPGFFNKSYMQMLCYLLTFTARLIQTYDRRFLYADWFIYPRCKNNMFWLPCLAMGIYRSHVQKCTKCRAFDFIESSESWTSSPYSWSDSLLKYYS